MPAGDGKGLAPATKDISTNPTANAVTTPTDPKFKAADVDRKMRGYGVVEAFREGKYPSNIQIEDTLKYVENNSPIDESKLSSEGKKLIKDVRNIIKSARRLILQKNEDELIQNFLFNTRHVDQSRINPANAVSTSVNKEDAKNDGEQAAEHLRTLGKLIYTNGEFRKLLKDCSYIGRDIAADAAQKAANAARPPEEKLNQVDETAPSNRWHGADGQVRGPNDPAPDTGLGEKVDTLKEKRNQAKDLKEQAKSEGQDAANRAQGAAQNAPGDNTSGPSGAQQGAVKDTLLNKAKELTPDDRQQQAQSHADDAARRVDSAVANASGPNTSAPRDSNQMSNLTEDEQRAAKEETKNTAKDKVLSAIPDKHREKVNEQVDRSKEYLQDKIPQERRDRFIYRAKKVIVEQQRHRDYQEAIDFFITMAETYHGHAKDVTAQTKDHAQGNVRSEPAYQKAELELRTLLERFANNTSMQPIINAIDQIYTDVQNDKELSAWFSELDKWIRRVLQEPGFVMKDQCDQEGRRLRENGKGFFSERYREHREALFTEVQNFFTAFADDPLNKQFGAEWKALTRDLLLDAEGNLKYKPHLWSDIRSTIAPQIFQHIGYVPIPRIEYTDNMLDLVIENLTLESQNLLPNIFEIEARTYHKLSPYSGIQDKSKQSVWISFSQVQADLRDVAFYFKKKSGFPKISDHGLADVFIGGNGLSGKIHIESTSRKGSIFHVREVKIKIDTLKFKIRDSKHNVLYATLRPLATGLIKKQIAKALQDAIRSGLGTLDDQLVEIRDRLDDAKADDETSRVDVMKSIFAEKKNTAEAGAKEADEKTGTFKIVTKRDSKIIGWSSPDSIVEKQGEHAEKAGRGVGWKSEAFSIVPGSRSDHKTASKGITSSSNVPSREDDGKHAATQMGAGKGASAAAAGAGAVGAGAGAAALASHHGSSGVGASGVGASGGLHSGSTGVTSGSTALPTGGSGLAGSNASSGLAGNSSTLQQPAAGAVTGGGLSGGPLQSSAAPGAGTSLVSPPNSSAPTAPTTSVATGQSGLPPPVGQQ